MKKASRPLTPPKLLLASTPSLFNQSRTLSRLAFLSNPSPSMISASLLTPSFEGSGPTHARPSFSSLSRKRLGFFKTGLTPFFATLPGNRPDNSNHCHTSKKPSCKSFACHTYETPQGGYSEDFITPRAHITQGNENNPWIPQIAPGSGAWFCSPGITGQEKAPCKRAARRCALVRHTTQDGMAPTAPPRRFG
jgi:hypothetical protein